MSPKKSARIGAPARGELLVEDDVLDDRQALAAVLRRPGGADPAALEELVRPGLVERGALVGGHREALVEPAVRQVLLQPRPDLLAELLGLGRIGQIHPAIFAPACHGRPNLPPLRSGGSSRSPGSSSSSPRPGPSCASQGRSDPSFSSSSGSSRPSGSCGSTGAAPRLRRASFDRAWPAVGFAVLVATVGLIAYPLFDERESTGGGSDADDAVVLVIDGHPRRRRPLCAPTPTSATRPRPDRAPPSGSSRGRAGRPYPIGIALAVARHRRRAPDRDRRVGDGDVVGRRAGGERPLLGGSRTGFGPPPLRLQPGVGGRLPRPPATAARDRGRHRARARARRVRHRASGLPVRPRRSRRRRCGGAIAGLRSRWVSPGRSWRSRSTPPSSAARAGTAMTRCSSCW